MSPRALTDERDVREAYAAHANELYGFALRSLGDAGLAVEKGSTTIRSLDSATISCGEQESAREINSAE